MKVTVSGPVIVERLPFSAGMGFWERLFAPQLWKVRETVIINIGDGHRHEHFFLVPAGLITDFASVPKFLRPFFPDAMLTGVAALAHDAMYASGEVGKRIADALLAGLLVDADGAREWQAEIFFLAVHCFGFVAWRAHWRQVGSAAPATAPARTTPAIVPTALAFTHREEPDNLIHLRRV